MNNTPFPKETDDNYDPNVDIDQEIYDRLFMEREPDEFTNNIFDEMRPYIYPDVE